MNKIPCIPSSKLSIRVLIYGLYACFCHGTAILLLAVEKSKLMLPMGLSTVIAPMIEHTIMSVALTLGGAMLIDIITKDL